MVWYTRNSGLRLGYLIGRPHDGKVWKFVDKNYEDFVGMLNISTWVWLWMELIHLDKDGKTFLAGLNVLSVGFQIDQTTSMDKPMQMYLAFSTKSSQ